MQDRKEIKGLGFEVRCKLSLKPNSSDSVIRPNHIIYLNKTPQALFFVQQIVIKHWHLTLVNLTSLIFSAISPHHFTNSVPIISIEYA